MDKENGKGNDGNNSGSSKVSNAADPTSLLDAAGLFGAYWPRGDANSNAAAAANLFAGGGGGGGGFGMPSHPSMPFGMLPPTSGRGLPSYPTSTAAAVYSNAYTNTLSVAASQAASLGIPAASAAWWSMASHLAAQDYLARLQASGLNFPSLGNPNDLQYASLGLQQQQQHSSHHKPSKKASASSARSREKNSPLSGLAKTDGSNSQKSGRYASSSVKLPPSCSNSLDQHQQKRGCANRLGEPGYAKTDGRQEQGRKGVGKAGSGRELSPGVFTSPPISAGGYDKSCSSVNTLGTLSSSCVADGGGNAPSSSTSSILSAALEGNSDPNSILGGVRLPPDTEIIKYTSSIVGPKIPGTTNRGRKKTISLDPPSVSVHPSHSSTGMLIDRGHKRPKLNDHHHQDVSSPPAVSSSDRVEVIKLPATNGSPSGLAIPSFNSAESGGDTPLNLSLKPSTSNNNNGSSSSSLNSLCNMSASLGADRISRRKPGPKPRRVVSSLHPGAPSASLTQLFASADSPRPPSRNEGSDGGSSTSSTCAASIPTTASTTISSLPLPNHKEGRPRNLGRGVSKPKKNTVASLLAQSRALGIKPMPILDSNATMNQQMNLLKSNILAAQQYISEAGGDEKALNKFLQEKFRGSTLSDSSTVDASTDSDNLTDSNQTDSEMEVEVVSKRQKQYDEKALRVPLEKGWKRETVIRGLTKSGGIKGDVTYGAPDSSNKFKQMSDITQYLEYQKNGELTKENFTFSCRVILGDYLQPVPTEMSADGGEFIYLSEDDVSKRLDELKAAMRTSLPVEQRIEMARKQQAARAAARLDREHARLAKEIERSERQEAARRDREARSQQLLEGRKRLAFTLEQKIQIISEIEAGKTKSDVSRELGLASSTVATIWKNRDNIINAYSSENLGRNVANPKKDSLFIPDILTAKRKRQEEHEKHKLEEQQRKQQEREFKRQQAAMLKEQMYIQEMSKQREMLYTVELERERRRQHMALVKALENRRKLEERERKKQQLLAEKQANKEKKLEQRKMEMEILSELRRPCEDLELDQKPLPEYGRIPGLKLPGKAFADVLMVFEFLHNFGETLGFDMESLPTLDSLQQALMPNSDHPSEAEEELFSVMTHLLVCAIEDPGIPNPARHTTILGQSLRQADITHANLSEILRIYLYANATGEVKALTGVHFERDRERRVADHHQNDNEMQQTQVGKNSQYYDLLHGNATWKLSDTLKDKPFMALSPTSKAEILAFICNELLQNKAVIRQIENSLDNVAQQRKEKWLLDTKIRKLRMMHGRKVRTEAVERAAQTPNNKMEGEGDVDSPSLHKDDLLDDEENDMSENESVGTQPEEEEDNKLSGEELGKKLEKFVKSSEVQLQSFNAMTHQLRATCFGQDRFWRRYWTLSKAGGVFVESMEAAEPDVLEEQIRADESSVQSLSDVDDIVNKVEEISDSNVDKEVSSIVGNVKMAGGNDANEHRKTPNRPVASASHENVMENGELERSERNLAELRKSVDDMVQNLERDMENRMKEETTETNHLDDGESDEPLACKKFNLFEKLGQCMERENKSEEDLKAEVKAEVKEELKNEILNELKVEIKPELIKNEVKVDEDAKSEPEHKWFGVTARDDTCEGVHLTAGNRWDNGVGACTRDNLTELKIPVFPPPGSNSANYHNLCDSPAPLQMTAEEGAQLEHIKKHGMPESCPRRPVPKDKRYGWWRITDSDELRRVLENLHVRGARERELKRNFVNVMQTMYEGQGKLCIEEGQKESTELSGEGIEDVKIMEGGAPYPDEPMAWSPSIAHRADLNLLEQVEALEDKVASASMQVKGWKIPNRDGPELTPNEVVLVIRERLSSLETNIERRYLKPPLGINSGGDANTSTQSAQDVSIGAGAAPAATSASSASAQQGPADSNEIPKGLAVWREAVNRAQTSAQLAMCLYSLESSIAWDKSIMKANCQFCHSGDNEDKLLLCDGCDKGYHTYCFKPKMENIPDGDWYCHECMNKATGERNCIVCGKKSSQSGTKLILCELCPRAYHTDCIHPNLNKAPRGKWYCTRCISKKPQKKPIRKNHAKLPNKDSSELSDHPPSSPAPSHSSVTTNEDQQTTNCCNQSDASNSSLLNAGSPSTASAAATAATSASAATVVAASSVSVAPPAVSGANQQQQQQNSKKDRATKKLLKELAPCKTILEDLECHDDAWPFLLPVNTKQFPTYKKIIKNPMDLSTIKKKLYDVGYKSKEEFCLDVRQIFNNCEVFNEDDSPVGKAGHCMRQFFETRWNELCVSSNS